MNWVTQYNIYIYTCIHIYCVIPDCISKFKINRSIYFSYYNLISISICICIYTYLQTFMCTYTPKHTLKCIYVCKCVYICKFIQTFMCIHTHSFNGYINTHICTYIYMFICVLIFGLKSWMVMASILLIMAPWLNPERGYA